MTWQNEDVNFVSVAGNFRILGRRDSFVASVGCSGATNEGQLELAAARLLWLYFEINF